MITYAKAKANAADLDGTASSAPSHETFGPKDFRNTAKLLALDNDAIVIFNPGKVVDVFIAGKTFQCCEFRSRGKVPGTELSMPPIRYFTEIDFLSIQAQMGQMPDERTLAWWDKSAGDHGVGQGAIEVKLPGGTETPGPVRMKAAVLKELLCSQFHEAVHAGGGNEFDAYSNEAEYRRSIGLPPRFADAIEIMHHIIMSGYSSLEISKAEESFQTWAGTQRDSEDLLTRYERLSKETAEKASRAEDLEIFEMFEDEFNPEEN